MTSAFQPVAADSDSIASRRSRVGGLRVSASGIEAAPPWADTRPGAARSPAARTARIMGRLHGVIAPRYKEGRPRPATENPAPVLFGGRGFVRRRLAVFFLGRHAARGGGRRLLLEIEHLSVAAHEDGLALLDVAAQDSLRNRVLEVVLDRPAERPRAVLLVVALLDQE